MSKFGISIISLFPWIIIFPWWVTHIFNEYFDFLETTPMRGINKKTIFDIKVWGFTHAWNPGSLKEVIKGIISRDILAPQLLDWIVFPNKKTCQKNSLEMIKKYDDNPNFFITVHSIKKWEELFDRGYKKIFLEVHPGLNMTWEEIKNWAKDKGKVLAIDLYHIRRDLRNDEMVKLNIDDKKSKLGNSIKALVELLPFAGVIHLSTDRGNRELEKFLNTNIKELNREYTDFEIILKTIHQQKYYGYFLLEIAPAEKWELIFFPIWYKKIISFIKKVKEVLKID